jgi:hypothetical protein
MDCRVGVADRVGAGLVNAAAGGAPAADGGSPDGAVRAAVPKAGSATLLRGP